MYNYLEDFSEGFALVVKDYKMGLIDTTGKEVILCSYDIITGNYDITGVSFKASRYGIRGTSFNEGLLAARKDNKWGFIDKTGKEIIPLIYDEIVSFFSKGVARVRRKEEKFHIDKTGQRVNR